MSEAEHTPGPWKISDSERVVLDKRGLPVGTAPRMVNCINEAKANARLISAAPELLEALQVVVERIGKYRPNDLATPVDQWLTEARAAIAKTQA